VELHKYPEVSGKKSDCKRKESLLFWKIQPMKYNNEYRTGIIAIYNGENQGKQSCLDVS
jgi:hypothetical protein